MAYVALFTAEFSSSYCYSEAVRAVGGAEEGASIECLTVVPWLIVESLTLPIVPSSILASCCETCTQVLTVLMYFVRSIPIFELFCGPRLAWLAGTISTSRHFLT